MNECISVMFYYHLCCVTLLLWHSNVEGLTHMQEHQQCMWLKLPCHTYLITLTDKLNCWGENRHKTWHYRIKKSHTNPYSRRKEIYLWCHIALSTLREVCLGFPPPLISKYNIDSFMSTSISQPSKIHKLLLTYTACYTHVQSSPNFVAWCD